MGALARNPESPPERGRAAGAISDRLYGRRSGSRSSTRTKRRRHRAPALLLAHLGAGVGPRPHDRLASRPKHERSRSTVRRPEPLVSERDGSTLRRRALLPRWTRSLPVPGRHEYRRREPSKWRFAACGARPTRRAAHRLHSHWGHSYDTPPGATPDGGRVARHSCLDSERDRNHLNPRTMRRFHIKQRPQILPRRPPATGCRAAVTWGSTSPRPRPVRRVPQRREEQRTPTAPTPLAK